MNRTLQRETELLRRSWQRQNTRQISQYLIRNVEDPRVNLNSILSRHFLISEIFGPNIRLMRKEIVFGIRMTRLMLDLDEKDPGDSFHGVINIFQRKWRSELAGSGAEKVSVLEPACGSAADYRCMDSFGMAPHMEYTGFDLCSSNISNAKRMFPSVTFETGNVLDMKYADKSFDYCVVHDLFEHLSREAISAAVSEICRVTRKKIFIGFFNMRLYGDHQIKRMYDTHYNLLSARKLVQAFRQHGAEARIRGLNRLVTEQYHSEPHYNKDAYYGIFIL